MLTPQNRFGRQGAAYLAAWLTDVGMSHNNRPIDQVVSLRYPSYAVRHPNHVCWLNHTMREYYDQWDAFSAPLSWKGPHQRRRAAALIHWADRRLLTKNVRKVFTISGAVKARLERWGRIKSEVLYPPPPQRAYRCETYGDYIFAVSRLAPLKRLSLLIEALAAPEAAGIRCVIAGEGEEQRGARACDRHSGVVFARKVDWPHRRAPAPRASRALPRRLFSAVRRGLRLRHGRGVRVAQARHHLHRQRRPGRAGG